MDAEHTVGLHNEIVEVVRDTRHAIAGLRPLS